jgi:hypothetical protein
LVCLAASTSIASHLRADVCPTSSITLLGCGTSSTQAAAMDTQCIFTQDAHFDLVADTLGLALQPEGFQGNGEVAAAERYRIVGPSPGTPVSLALRMPISATLYVTSSDTPGTSSGTAKLEVDGVVLAQADEVRDCCCEFQCTTTGQLTTSLTAVVSIPAGQDFVVVTRLSASVRGGIPYPATAHIEAGFHIDDLPAGVGVVSCHGESFGTVGVGDDPSSGSLQFLSTGANPSRGLISVDFFVPRAGPVTIRLLDLAGRVLESERLDTASGRNAATLGSTRSLAPGTYVVRLTQAADSRSRLVTVVR